MAGGLTGAQSSGLDFVRKELQLRSFRQLSFHFLSPTSGLNLPCALTYVTHVIVSFTPILSQLFPLQVLFHLDALVSVDLKQPLMETVIATHFIKS